MIVAEGSLWPIVIVGAVSAHRLFTDQSLVIPDTFLAASERVACGLVVGGHGTEASRAHQAMLEWWRQRQHWLMPRTRRLAWIIGDEAVRQSTGTWLHVLSDAVGARRSAVFPGVRGALDWLLDTPWPLRPAATRPV